MYLHIAIALLTLSPIVASAHADSWQEREALSHAMRELRAIHALSVSARAVSDEDSRTQFDCGQLYLALLQTPASISVRSLDIALP